MRKRKTAVHQRKLIDAAVAAKEKSYSPYSRFRVGAALLTDDGSVYAGCNVENSSYSLTLCAERTALFKAVSEGHLNFKAIAIASDDRGFLPPCGACRQALSEFAPDMRLILTTPAGDVKVTSLGKLFPMRADLKRLGNRSSN